MEELHRLLRRQLRRHFGSTAVPSELESFLQDVNRAYQESDQDRGMLERSLELSSRELFQANSEMRVLLQAIPDRFCRINTEGLILSVRGEVKDTSDPHPPLRAGSRIQELPGEELGARYAEALSQFKDQQTSVSFEYMVGEGPARRCYEARLIPLYRDEILVILRDMTERRHLEEQFRQAQKMDAFGQLAGGVAHDFNNLLTVIQGNLSMLQVGALEKEESSEAIEEALHAAQRAGNLTRQLLTFGRRQPLRLCILDLNEVVAGMAKMLHRIIGEHINLEHRFACGDAGVRADATLLEQALLNLAVNSRDAMPGGGTLSITTSHVVIGADDPRLGLYGRRAGSFIELAVADTGCGIPPENLSHLFEPFFTTKEVGKGTGLGLATVFGVVEQHGGWIEVESQEGKGSVFRLFFEQVADASPGRKALDPLPGNEPRGGCETILIVEDELSVRNLVSRWLEKKGYKVLTASSGPAALRVWEQGNDRIDMLLTDMVMPDGMTGYELAQRLLAEKPALKVMFCSGYSEEMLTAGIEGENFHFVPKPYDRIPFLRLIRACFDGEAPVTWPQSLPPQP